jgi:chromosome partitioning protein
VEGQPAAESILSISALPFLSVLPATQDLVGAELQLVERDHRDAMLRQMLEGLHEAYDYIIVDCPPSLGLLTLNVLAAANGVVIPIQCEYYGLEGISQLLNTVRLVQQNFNPDLAIYGVLLTMYDSRLNLCRQVAEDAKEYFGAKVFATPIPRNVRLAEAPSFGKPILLYDPQSVGAKSYLSVAQELLRRIEHPGVTLAEPPVAASSSGGTPAEASEAAAVAQERGAAASAGAGSESTSAPASVATDGAESHPEVDQLPEVTTHE